MENELVKVERPSPEPEAELCINKKKRRSDEANQTQGSRLNAGMDVPAKSLLGLYQPKGT